MGDILFSTSLMFLKGVMLMRSMGFGRMILTGSRPFWIFRTRSMKTKYIPII